MKKVYVVKACTGAYEDAASRILATYPTRASAEAHKRAAEKFMRENGLDIEGDFNTDPCDRVDIMEDNPYDPSGWVDYTGVSYLMAELDLTPTFADYKKAHGTA